MKKFGRSAAEPPCSLTLRAKTAAPASPLQSPGFQDKSKLCWGEAVIYVLKL